MFESYLQDRKKPLGSRLLTQFLSIALHGGAVALVLFLSLFYVEELPEPQVTVTFFAAAPPPPPPPPPPAPKIKTKKVVRTQAQVSPADVQPPDRPMAELKPEPKEEPGSGSDDGVEGGVEGGVPGGVPTAAAPRPKKEVFVPPTVGEKLKVSGSQPVYLEVAKRAGVQGIVIIKLCIKTNGRVDASKTKILKGIPVLDNEVLSKVKTWRYKPYTVDGVATPACFPVRFVFRLR